MIRGLSAGASALLAQQTTLDATAQNLANVSTAGYRRQITTTGSFQKLVDGPVSQVVGTAPALPPPTLLYVTSSADTSQGAMRQTGNPTDLALEGNGYFTVQTPGAGEAYTRDGAFSLDANNRLVTSEGLPVLGERGPITIANSQWNVTRTGQVVVNGAVVDRLKLVTLPDPSTATRTGNNLFAASTAQPATQATVLQGYLEGSNVNPVSEMLALINSSRMFEANQRCIQALDSTLDRAVNEIARA